MTRLTTADRAAIDEDRSLRSHRLRLVHLPEDSLSILLLHMEILFGEVLVLRSDSATFDGPAPALRELAKVTVGPHHALTNLNMAD